MSTTRRGLAPPRGLGRRSVFQGVPVDRVECARHGRAGAEVSEILSPSTARDDRRLKLPMYARAGVPWVWLVDPDLRMLEVYQTRDGLPTLVHGAKDDDQTNLPPFDFPVSLAGWWKPR